MNITRPAERTSKRVRKAQGKSGLNLYPLLGIVLAILLAVLTYGALFFFL